MSAKAEAVELYHSAHDHGGWHQICARLCGRAPRLLDLRAFTAAGTIRSRHYQGLQMAPIAQIRGSEGRSHLFDDAFHPRDARSRDRWISVATAWLQGIGLPPVELIRVGDVYFVRDGLHRVSVARALKLQEIEATVTVYDVAGAAQPQTRMGWQAPWTWARA